jgi:hypothetical protein
MRSYVPVLGIETNQPTRKANHMDLNIHDVDQIETQIVVFENFNILEITVKDSRGRYTTIKLYADEIESLEQKVKPLKVAYNR